MQRNGVILVCVTPQKSSGYLVEYAQRMAQEHDCALRILSVLPQKQSFAPDLSVLETLNETARETGADMTVCFSDFPADKVIEVVRDSDIKTVLAGFPGKHSTHFLQSLHKKLPAVQLWLVDNDGSAYTIGRAAQTNEQPDGTFRVVLHSKSMLS